MAPVALVAAGLVLATSPVAAAPVLRAAQARVVFVDERSCTVDLTLRIDDADDVEHRLGVDDDARARVTDTRGTSTSGGPRRVGATLALTLRPTAPDYSLRYVVEHPEPTDRCPLWLPDVPADGRSRAVTLVVEIPAGTRAAGTMPAFAWAGTRGEVTLGHLPAFVRVPFTRSGERAPWNIARVMDLVAVATLALASVIWARRRVGAGR